MAANTLVTPSWVMKEVGRRLVNNLKFGSNVNRSYDDQYVVQGAKVGYTVSARLPQRYQVNKGQALSLTAVTDQVVPITLTDQANVGIEFSTASLTMEVDAYRERYIAPAVDALVNQVDYDGLSRMYKSVYWAVGTPGTVVGSGNATAASTNLIYLGAGVKLSNAAVPIDGRIAILNPEMHAYLAAQNQALFHPAGTISEAYRNGQFGRGALGIAEWFSDQNVAVHTTGSATSCTPTVTTAPTNGATTISTGSWASGATTLKQGDVVQFAGCYAINPLNYQSTGQLMDFVVTATTSDSSANIAALPVSPGFTFSGVNAVCSAAPAASAAITIWSSATYSVWSSKTSPQALVYHPDAFALVMADLELPGGIWVAERISNKALGISVRFLKDYNVMSDQSPARLDILYGWKAIRPEMACRIAS